MCERFLISRAAVTRDAVVLGQISGSMDGWSESRVMKSFLMLPMTVESCEAHFPHSLSLSLSLVHSLREPWGKLKWCERVNDAWPSDCFDTRDRS